MRDGSCCLLRTLNITTFLEKHEKLPAVFLWLELEVRALGALRARGAVCPSCSARCSRVRSPGEQPGVGGARAAADPRVAAGTAAPADTLRPPALSRVSHRRWRFPARGGRSSPGACEVVFACCRDASASGYSYPRQVKRAPQPLLGHLSWENSCSLTGGILR